MGIGRTCMTPAASSSPMRHDLGFAEGEPWRRQGFNAPEYARKSIFWVPLNPPPPAPVAPPAHTQHCFHNLSQLCICYCSSTHTTTCRINKNKNTFHNKVPQYGIDNTFQPKWCQQTKNEIYLHAQHCFPNLSQLCVCYCSSTHTTTCRINREQEHLSQQHDILEHILRWCTPNRARARGDMGCFSTTNNTDR